MQKCAVAALAIVIGPMSPAEATTASKARTCTPDKAIYRAALRAKNARPDELRLSYKDPVQTVPFGLPRVIITSAQRDFEINLEPYFSNGSGVIGVNGQIPFDKLPAVT
jgi:hypothetical protein